MIPSLQVHSASLTYALSYGMPCITTNGWGISEFCVDGFNSLRGEVESDGYASEMTRRIKELCENRSLLIKKSQNTLALSKSNHSRTNHKNNFANLINMAMRQYNL